MRCPQPIHALSPLLLILVSPACVDASTPAAAFFSGPRGSICKKLSSLLSASKSPKAIPAAVYSFNNGHVSRIYACHPATLTELKGIWRRSMPMSRWVVALIPELGAYSANFLTGFGLNSALALVGLAVKQRWLTSSGLLHAWILGIALWSTLGWRGWALCVLYLICGSLVTKVKQSEKEALGIAEKRGGARGPENVWGSAAAGTICATATIFLPAQLHVLLTGYVASLATKLSDTFASEIGKAYGKRTFLITNLKPVPPGTEGAISLEGTLAGVVGSVIIALAGVGMRFVAWKAVPVVLVAAFLATNVESLLGASLQNDRHPWATNEFINFLNTLIGSLLGIGMVLALRLAAPA